MEISRYPELKNLNLVHIRKTGGKYTYVLQRFDPITGVSIAPEYGDIDILHLEKQRDIFLEQAKIMEMILDDCSKIKEVLPVSADKTGKNSETVAGKVMKYFKRKL